MIFTSILAGLVGSTANRMVNEAANNVRLVAGDRMVDAVQQVGRTARAAIDTRKQSLVSYSSPGKVEPVCYIDADCANSTMLPNLLQAELSVFMGYWLRAFTLDNTTIGGVSVANRLEKYSTHRAPDYLGAIGLESLDTHLPFDKKMQKVPEVYTKYQAALEAQSINPNKSKPLSNQQKGQEFLRKAMGSPEATLKSDTSKLNQMTDFDASVNMAVGKIFNVEVVQEQAKIVVPVIARLNCMFVPTQALIHIYTSSSQDIDFDVRWKQWWHGKIDFWKDLVYTQDLIDAHRKNLREDKSGFYQMMLKRRSNNVEAALVSGVPSVAASSTIIIMSAATADEIGSKLGGKLSDFRMRQRFFEQGYAMLMAVIDERHGSVRMYTRDMAEYTDVSASALESSARGSGPNVGDILSAFRAGQSPIL